MFWCFGHKACGILAPQPGIEPTPPALEGEVPTTGPPLPPPGKPLLCIYYLTSLKMENLGGNKVMCLVILYFMYLPFEIMRYTYIYMY